MKILVKCIVLKKSSKTDNTAVNLAQLDTAHLSIIYANQNDFNISVHQLPLAVAG
jgi:hypothetical protein